MVIKVIVVTVIVIAQFNPDLKNPDSIPNVTTK